ncbi:hypothetical protein R3P38DRAFT_2868016 [Favolaschia claudopus]|uniref:Uncharacterized protein n=1 Tax=Favolaschia claudopus TaxID=2862362 RepID=A0AAW0D9C9_9AGAR
MLATVRAASSHCRLVLQTIHHVSGHTTQKTLKTRFPDDIDVVLASDLVFTLSGVLNGVKLASDDILGSQLAQHLVDYFKLNAAELGISTVSSMYIDQDGILKFKVVSSRCPPELRRVHVTLLKIDLNYVWYTNTSQSLIHPFSNRLSLPFKIMLDNVIPRFFTCHLVRRYPLIFGPWSQQLDFERPYFNKIFCAISAMISRSPNASFRKKCSRMLHAMQDQHSASLAAATASLADFFGSSEDVNDEGPMLTDGEAFSLSMEIRYRTCLRRPKFKGTTQARDGSDDEELSQDQSLLTPESSQNFDEGYLWSRPPFLAKDDFLDFDDLPLVTPFANIETPFVLDMGIDKEYQDPAEFWSDSYSDHDELLLSLSSSDEVDPASSSQEEHLPDFDDDFDLPPPSLPLVHFEFPSSGFDGFRRDSDDDELGLDLDTNMDPALDRSHAFGSPDEPVLQTSPPRTQSLALSPPALPSGSDLSKSPAERYFPGLSRVQCQTDVLDYELSFDSDSSSEEHDLVEFGDLLHGTEHLNDTCSPAKELEHQVGNAGIGADVGVAAVDRLEDQEEAFLFDLEDW